MKSSATSKTLLKMLFSRPSLASSNKGGQKVSSISHRTFKTTVLSKKSLHFKRELFFSSAQKKATLQSSGSTGMPETREASFLLAWYVRKNWRIYLRVSSLRYIPPRVEKRARDLTPSTIKTMAGPCCWSLCAPGPGPPCHYWLSLKFLWGWQAC